MIPQVFIYQLHQVKQLICPLLWFITKYQQTVIYVITTGYAFFTHFLVLEKEKKGTDSETLEFVCQTISNN